MSRRVTVAQLAARADLDLDDALVSLWDAGIDDVDDPDDVLSPKLRKIAEEVLGIENSRRQTRIDYWLKRTGMTRDEFVEDVDQIGVRIKPNVKTLPKGGLRRVRRRFESKPPIDPKPPTKPIAPTAHQPPGPFDECPPFEWVDVGVRRELTFLEDQDLLDIHEALVKDFALADDPISPPGVRSPDLLSSAVFRTQTANGNQLKYPTVEMAAAALLYAVVHNHAFHNGNKRTGLVSMLAFLDRNNMIATCDENDLFRFTLRVAQHRLRVANHRLDPQCCDHIADREVLEIARWIKNKSRQKEKGERPISWLRLKRILRKFDCEVESASKGSQLNIQRKVDSRNPLGRKRTKTLKTRVAWSGDGSEVVHNTLNKVRRDLKLDEPNGVDSAVFYEDEAVPDDFIQQYRTVLRRLARL